ncbi:MAG: hypothetical protein PHY16_15660 [Methylobacter sp.]|nr:hypothetical protein [Methylobacter sp.]
MTTDADLSWFPLFEFQDYIYQSFLMLPTVEENSVSPGASVTAKKWAKGDFIWGQAFGNVRGKGQYSLNGILRFSPELELSVSVKGMNGSGHAPAPFDAMGTGTEGAAKGAIYSLVGWVFPEEPIVNQAVRVLQGCGSVRAVRGPDARPGLDLDSMPLETVGSFVIVRIGIS